MLHIIWFSQYTEDFSYWGRERRFTLLSIVSWIAVGVTAAVLARLLTKEKDQMSWPEAAILGIAGSCLGGLIAGFMGLTCSRSCLHPTGLLLSVIGSLLLLLVWRRQRSA